MAKLIIPVIPVAREIMERLAKARGNLVQKKVEVKTRRGSHYRMQWVKPENDRAWSEKEQPGLFDDIDQPKPRPEKKPDSQKTQSQLLEEMTDDVDKLLATENGMDSRAKAYAEIIRNPGTVSTENLKRYSDIIKDQIDRNAKDKYDADIESYIPAIVAAQKLRILALKALADEKAKRAAMKAEGKLSKQKDAEGAVENSAGGKYRVEKNKYGTYDLQYKGPRGQNWNTISGQMAVPEKLESEMDDAIRMDNEAIEKLNSMGLFDKVKGHFTEYPPSHALEVVQIMKKKIDDKQIDRIMGTLDNPANKLSRSVFEAITGKKIEGKNGHEKAVEEYFGKEAMDAWRGEVQRETEERAVKDAERKRSGVIADVERIKYRDPKTGGVITAKELIDGYMKDVVSVQEYKRGAISVMWIEGPGGSGPEFKSKAEKDYIRLLQSESAGGASKPEKEPFEAKKTTGAAGSSDSFFGDLPTQNKPEEPKGDGIAAESAKLREGLKFKSKGETYTIHFERGEVRALDAKGRVVAGMNYRKSADNLTIGGLREYFNLPVGEAMGAQPEKKPFEEMTFEAKKTTGKPANVGETVRDVLSMASGTAAQFAGSNQVAEIEQFRYDAAKWAYENDKVGTGFDILDQYARHKGLRKSMFTKFREGLAKAFGYNRG